MVRTSRNDRPNASSGVLRRDTNTVAICNVDRPTYSSTPPPEGRTVSRGDPVAVRPSRPTPPSPRQRERCVVLLIRPRDPARAVFSAARWELAMLRIQADHLALNLNVLAVCAVFVFVGALLLGAF